jgi:hypothetical protein
MNKAGINRDRMLVSMTEADWDTALTTAPRNPMTEAVEAFADHMRARETGFDAMHPANVSPPRGLAGLHRIDRSDSPDPGGSSGRRAFIAGQSSDV